MAFEMESYVIIPFVHPCMHLTSLFVFHTLYASISNALI